MRLPPAEILQAATGEKMTDVIALDLNVLFCGINPSLMSVVLGHHFARPGNRFWKTLHASGFTPRLLLPDEDHTLPNYGLGITNIVKTATRSADQLSADDLRAGTQSLVEKVERFCPRYLAVLGIGAYRTGFGRPHATLGPQPETIGGTRLWVLPNPSGLNAHYQSADLARLFRELKMAASV